ncbi:MAG: DUF5372 family protein [bacterium]
MVVVTHPIHPLAGRALPVVRYLREAGRACVVVRFPDDGPVTIPLDWTDRRPAVPPLALRGKVAKLHPRALPELCARVADLGVKRTATDAGQELDTADRRIRVETREQARLDLRSGLDSDTARAAGPAGERDPQSRSKRGRRPSKGK